jgi:hypothetical protein
VRDHWMGGLRARPEGGAARDRGDDLDDGKPRSGRGRGMELRARGHRAPEAVGHRLGGRRAVDAGRPRRLGRGRGPGRADLQRRGLQLHRAPQRADGPRARVPDALGHRGGAARLPAVGCGLRVPAERHVRVRHLGRAAPGTAAGPGPARREAAVLRAAAGRRAVRFRTEGDPGAPRLPR